MMVGSEFLLNFLVNSLWQIPVVCALAALGTFLLRNSSARYRHTVWVTALFFCLIVPAITAVEVVPAYTFTPTTISVDGDDQVTPDHTRRRQSSQVVVDATPGKMQFVTAAYLVFLALAAVRFVRLWRTKERLRRSVSFDGLTPQIEIVTRRCREAFGVEKVQVGRSSIARVPYALGIRRPLIVLPDSFCGDVDQETLLSVIGHEMAHVRRRDFLTKVICELVSLPITFHPFTWFFKHRIEQERELACDELVTQQVLQPTTYARSLLRAADLSMHQAGRSMMLSVFDGQMIEERIKQLTRKRLPLSNWSGRIITAAVLGALCLSSVFGSAFGFSLRVPITTPIAAAAMPETPVAVVPQEPIPDRNRQNPRYAPNPRMDSTTAQEVAQSACDAGKNRDTEAIASLVALLADDRKVEPIPCWTSGRWTPALDTFKHPSPGEQAALALASMGRDAFGPLMNQLGNANAVTRRNAAWAIGELTNMPPGERAPAIPQLVTLLRDSDPWVRMAAARAIGEVRDGRATETLIATLSDADWRVRRLAAWALNEMKERRAVAALCHLLLGDSHAEVRRAAAEALGEIASAEALPSLQQALNDPETAVRTKVSWAIAEIEDN